jgi:hypothetical protein
MDLQTDCLEETKAMCKGLIQNLESCFEPREIFPVTVKLLGALQEINNRLKAKV